MYWPNDTDSDGDTLTLTRVDTTSIKAGAIVDNNNGTITYTPAANFNGNDSFNYSISDGNGDPVSAVVNIIVTPLNDAPNAQDQQQSVNEDGILEVTLQAIDLDGDILSYSLISQTNSGTLSGTAPSLSYTPNANFNGTDRFTFQANDGQSDSNIATVTITVNAVNDAAIADNLNVQTTENNAVSFVLIGNDPEGDALTYAILSAPQNGSLSGSDENLRYTPNTDFFGSDSFTYQVNDGALNSNIATVFITVILSNRAPTITSLPNLTATQNSFYQYDVEASDVNPGDTLTYSLDSAPANAVIDPSTGLIDWIPATEMVGHNSSDNPYCAASQEADTNYDRASDVIVIMDESGSMGGEHGWISSLIPLFDAHLRSNKIGDNGVDNLFGLVGFGNRDPQPHQIDVGGQALGKPSEFVKATEQLELYGSFEDGWAGLKFALGYPLRETTSKNMVLVTDEYRGDWDKSLTYDSVLSDLKAQNIVLNVVVNATFKCPDDTPALGMGQNNIGYVADRQGGYTICENAVINPGTNPSDRTEQDYIDMALALGGAAWDLNVLRGGGINAQSFSKAFIDIKIHEIKKHFLATPQPDLLIQDLNYNDGVITVTVKNRGQVDIASPINVVLKDDLIEISSLSIAGLVQGETLALTHTAVVPITGNLRAEIIPLDSSIVECGVDNNILAVARWDVAVSDEEGLEDHQVFSFSVSDINEPPSIVSNPILTASVGAIYEYQIEVFDPDTGDGFLYELLDAPEGMMIDSLSGKISFKAFLSQAGQHNVSIKVTDINGLSDTQMFSLNVDASYLPPKFISEPIYRAIQATEYRYQTQVENDPSATLRYRLFNGPQGITIDELTGEVIWQVPDNIGGELFHVILQVQDQLGNYDIQSYYLLEDYPPMAPVIGERFYPIAEQGGEYNISISATDGNIENTHIWNLNYSPENSMIDASTAIFTWSPVKVTRPGVAIDLNTQCYETDSVLADLEVTTKWVSHDSYIGQPLVGPLYDSNQDGILNEEDRKVVIGVTNRRNIVALDAETGKEIWRRTDVDADFYNIGTLTNLDGDSNAEFVFVNGRLANKKMVALNSDGSTRWVSNVNVSNSSDQYNAVYPADLDNDGSLELLFGPSVFDADGQLVWKFPDAETHSWAGQGNPLAIDIDLDGLMEVIYYDQIRDWQGNLIWKVQSGTNRTVYNSHFASGNFDSDPEPEIVMSEYSNIGSWLRLIDNDGTQIWETKSRGHGGIVLADVDNDASLDIYLSAGNVLYDEKGAETWFVPGFSSTYPFGATFADVDADGYLDILRYSTGSELYIFEGRSGRVSQKFSINRDGATAHGAPVFVDLDNDGQGEILVGGHIVKAFEGKNLNWPSATHNYSYLHQSIEAVLPNLQVKSAYTNHYGQTNYPAAAVRESARLSDLVFESINVYPKNNQWRIDLSIANRGLDAVAEGTIVEFYTDDPTIASNKFSEITLPGFRITEKVRQYIDINDPSLLGRETFAVFKPGPDTKECSTDNNIISASTFEVIVTDIDYLSDTQWWGIGAINTTGSPNITSTASTTAQTGSVYEYQTVAVDPDEFDIVHYYLDAGPYGATIDSVTGLMQWMPNQNQVGSHDIAIVARDLSGKTDRQTFTINVSAGSTNRPPVITSSANELASPGLAYLYDTQATDPDGDDLRYSLTAAPAGMSINVLSGEISWLPDTLGIAEITVEVRDEGGLSATQNYSLTVRRNSPPEIISTANTSVTGGLNYYYTVEALDPDGDSIRYSVTNGPSSLSIVSENGFIQWQTTISDLGQHPVTIRATDSVGGYTEQAFTLSVIETLLPLSASLTITPAIVDEGDSVTIQLTPINAVDPFTVNVVVDGNPVSLNNIYQAHIIANGVGRHSVEATVTDTRDTAAASNQFHVRDPQDVTPPHVNIAQPLDASVVTEPTDVMGSIEDANLKSWRLFYQEKGGPADAFVVIGQGQTNVSEQVLGVFDPTMLLNGQYAIVLEATDTNGQTSQVAVSVSVEGELKVGHFSITFEDVNIPLAGIPIIVTRTYDTRQKHQNLDFGYGWSVDYQNVRLHESRIVGLGWSLNEYNSGFFPQWCVEPNGDPMVSVTLPNGRVEKFIAKANPHCNAIIPAYDVALEFEPMEGTTSTLEQTDFSFVRIVGNDIIDIAQPTRPVDPQNYRLTTADGLIYELDQGFNIRKVTEPNGHFLTFDENGVTHSGGKSVSFVRDENNNITAINLPDGTQIRYEYDAQGNLTVHRNQLDEPTQFTYNSSHGLLDIINADGVRVARNEYDDNGRLIAQIDADGNRLEFTHDLGNHTETIRNRRGFTQVYSYDSYGNVVSETNALGETITRTYDTRQNELSRTDHLGNTTSWTYDNKRNQLSETDALGHTTHYSYNALNKPLTETDADGNVRVTNFYKDDYQLTIITNALGDQTNIAYDNLTQEIGSIGDRLGNVATYGYNGDDLTSETNANGVATTYTYDDMGRKLSETTTRRDENNAVHTLTTSYEYDAKGRLIKTTNPAGAITQSEYNLFDKETASIDALGRRTTYDYDDRGNRIKTTYPDLTTELHAYDEENNLISQTDRNGRVTTMEYDAANRLTKTIYPDQSETRTEYDAAGRVIAQIDQRGNRSEFTLDAAGRQIEVKDALNNITTYEYDKRGNRIKMIDANNQVYQYTYDLSDRLIQTTFPDNSVSTTSYDVRGRKIRQTDQAGITTRFEYDGVGNLVKVIDALNQETRYGYDEQNNKIRQTDAENRTTTWAYDNNNRPISRTLPMGQTEMFAYNLLGNRTQHIDFNGQTTTFTYDNQNRETRRNYQTDTTYVETTYTSTGQVASITDQHGITAYQYDVQDRLSKITYPNGQVIDYQYDVSGNRTQVKTQSSMVNYTFDALNRLATVADSNGITSYQYDKVGNRAAVNYANGTSIEYAYNNLNRLTQVVHKDRLNGITEQFDYTLGASGNRTQLAELSGRVSNYAYDNLYRLTQEQVIDAVNGNRTTSFTYDKVGNRLTQVEGPTTTTYSYNDNDQLTEENDGSLITTYQYDDNGNAIQKAEGPNITSYQYSQDNRLINTTTGSDSIIYTYDASGIRQSQIINGRQTRYLVDPNRDYAQVIAELDNTNAVSKQYTYGDDLISQQQNSQRHYYMYDGLGSTRSLTDNSGNQTDTYLYTAFGEIEHQTGSASNYYLFAGEQYDPNAGFYYLRARYYDPNVGRFTQLDTFAGVQADPVTLHKYLYGNVDPINTIDPSGNFGLGGAFAVLNIAVSISVAFQTGFSIGQFATGEKAFNAKEAGIAVIWALAGSKANILTNGLVRFLRKAGCLSNSFAANTLVETKAGLKRIGQIKEGELVLSFNAETNKTEYQPVMAIMESTYKTNLIIIQLESGEIIEATPEHLVFADEKWFEARHLTKKMHLINDAGLPIKIEKLSKTVRMETIYDLTIKQNHNFYASRDRVLVHNISPCEKAAQALAKVVPKACLGVKNKCDDYVVEFERLLLKKNVKGKRLCIKSNRWPYVSSLKHGNISGNNQHFAVQVGEMVFDNMYSEGIPFAEWAHDIGLNEDIGVSVKSESMKGSYSGCIPKK